MDKLHRTITARGAPAMANRTLATASRLFAMAAKWQMRPENQNPCKGIEHNQGNKRHRYLTDDEAERLTAALARLKDQESANALRLLMLTGARKSEVLKARWDQFDLKRGTWTKPGSTTKQKTDHHVPLSGPALELLRGLGGGPGFVFPRLAGPYQGGR
jgi:integrase